MRRIQIVHPISLTESNSSKIRAFLFEVNRLFNALNAGEFHVSSNIIVFPEKLKSLSLLTFETLLESSLNRFFIFFIDFD